ncbi:hypothetical protein [Streptomyces lasiicapitis]|uniref:Uncharacterized protein n=1 Tax=Streptomyces lasiicapitis TaxID=1923961 RepID=A0ABQ2MYB3_9ACTN|nr:hypothetical protein [Streptomyces lasiicapitis]GGO60123.1 hypothetical protein GCM10012286_83290 [Streptomyces lasiicapitis]
MTTTPVNEDLDEQPQEAEELVEQGTAAVERCRALAWPDLRPYIDVRPVLPYLNPFWLLRLSAQGTPVLTRRLLALRGKTAAPSSTTKTGKTGTKGGAKGGKGQSRGRGSGRPTRRRRVTFQGVAVALFAIAVVVNVVVRYVWLITGVLLLLWCIAAAFHAPRKRMPVIPCGSGPDTNDGATKEEQTRDGQYDAHEHDAQTVADEDQEHGYDGENDHDENQDGGAGEQPSNPLPSPAEQRARFQRTVAHLIGSRNGVHFATIAEHLRNEGEKSVSVADVKARCEAAGIPVSDGVNVLVRDRDKTVKRNRTGVRRAEWEAELGHPIGTLSAPTPSVSSLADGVWVVRSPAPGALTTTPGDTIPAPHPPAPTPQTGPGPLPAQDPGPLPEGVGTPGHSALPTDLPTSAPSPGPNEPPPPRLITRPSTDTGTDPADEQRQNG